MTPHKDYEIFGYIINGFYLEKYITLFFVAVAAIVVIVLLIKNLKKNSPWISRW